MENNIGQADDVKQTTVAETREGKRTFRERVTRRAALYAAGAVAGSVAAFSRFGLPPLPAEMVGGGMPVVHAATTLVTGVMNVYNVQDYQAIGNGMADDTSAINSAIAAAVAAGGGIVYLPTGIYLISSPLFDLSAAGVQLRGNGRQATILRGASTFNGAQFIRLTADYCGVCDMRLDFASSSTASNPPANGIELSGARYATLQDLEFYYLNGWCVEAAVTANATNQGAIIDRVHCLSTNGGIHVLSSSGPNNNIGQVWMSNLNLEQVDGPLDAVLIEDSNDILIVNFGGAVVPNSNTNHMLHVVGSSSAIFLENVDIGVYLPAGSVPLAPVVLVESNANGSPNRVSIVGGVIQRGTYCIQATAGANFIFADLFFRAFTTMGVSIESSANYFQFSGCQWNSGGTTGSSGRYDLQVTNAAARVVIDGCMFRDTGVGSGTGQVNAVISLVASNHVYVTNNDFENSTAANGYNGGVLPAQLVNNSNHNPIGSVSVAVGPSPYSVPRMPYPVTYFVHGGSDVSMTVGGVATGLASGAIHVPPNTTLQVTYSSAPTITGYGE